MASAISLSHGDMPAYALRSRAAFCSGVENFQFIRDVSLNSPNEPSTNNLLMLNITVRIIIQKSSIYCALEIAIVNRDVSQKPLWVSGR